jgi:hypothetical protein
MNAKQRRRRRLRCLGHVINLAAQAFLFGKKSQETLDELDLAYRRHDFEAMAKVWRKQGVLRRLHNIIRYIRMTPQRRAESRKTVIGTLYVVRATAILSSNGFTLWTTFLILLMGVKMSSKRLLMKIPDLKNMLSYKQPRLVLG